MDKTFCIFGDSVPQAAYVNIGWVDLLRKYLEGKFPDDFVNVFNLGVGGNTTEDLLKRIESESESRKPTSILIGIGINDTKLDNEKEFRNNLIKILNKAKKFTNEVMFVGLVLGDWTGEDHYSQEKTIKYNFILKEVADLNNIKIIELFSKLKPEDFIDGLHPNDQGHRKMFEEIKNNF